MAYVCHSGWKETEAGERDGYRQVGDHWTGGEVEPRHLSGECKY